MGDRRVIPNVLSDQPLTRPVEIPYQPAPLMPGVKVIKMGGQSIMDRGRAAVFPLVAELVAAKEQHKVLVCTGGGTRARHMYSVCTDLQMPTGVLAALGGYVPRQNARMLQMLLSAHGGLFMMHDDFEKLPLYFQMGCIPIMGGMPPFGYWEKPPERGQIPPHRTDAGAFLSAEALGVSRVIMVKDERGLFSDDPKKNPQARFIERISAADLLKEDLPDLAVERVVVEYLPRARFCREVQIINGLEKGMLTRALAGEDVGSIITAE